MGTSGNNALRAVLQSSHTKNKRGKHTIAEGSVHEQLQAEGAEESDKTAQWVRLSAVHPDNPSSNSGIPMLEGDRDLHVGRRESIPPNPRVVF